MNGDQLRKARERLALTQVGLAELIGTTGNTIARWERGEVSVNEVAARFILHLVEEHGSRPGRKYPQKRKKGGR